MSKKMTMMTLQDRYTPVVDLNLAQPLWTFCCIPAWGWMSCVCADKFGASIRRRVWSHEAEFATSSRERCCRHDGVVRKEAREQVKKR